MGDFQGLYIFYLIGILFYLVIFLLLNSKEIDTFFDKIFGHKERERYKVVEVSLIELFDR